MDKSSEETLLNYLKAHSRVCQRLMRNISLEDINGSEKVASPRLARIKYPCIYLGSTMSDFTIEYSRGSWRMPDLRHCL